MMTIAQARAAVGQQIGFPATFDGSVAAYRDLTQAQQLDLTRALINYIRNNPGQFTEAQVATANSQAGQASTFTAQDTSFDLGLFWDELENNAVKTIGEPLAKIGDGVATSFSLVGTLLPVLVLGAIAVALFPYVKNHLSKSANA